MARAEIHQKLFLIFSILVVVTLPYSVRLNSYSIILLSLNWLLEGNWKNRWKLLTHNKYALLFGCFYLIHVFALLYTKNIHQGLFELEKKIGFIIFPVIFATSTYLTHNTALKILHSFVGACLVGAIICLVNGFYFYLDGDSSFLFYHKLGAIINFNHAIYFSLYIGFSIFILLTQLRSNWQSWIISKKLLCILIVLIFMLFLILLSSKIIIAAVFFLLIILFVQIIIEAKGRLLAALALFFGFAFFSLLTYTVPNIRERFEEVFIDKYDQVNPLLLDDYFQYHFTGWNVRLAIWKTAVISVNEEKAWIFGVGTGDSQDVLTAAFEKRHMYPGDALVGSIGFLDYNAHNQFVQAYHMFGIVGLLWFILILVFLFKESIKKDQTNLLFCLLFLFTAFCLTESVMQVQKGIVFFVFFSSLLVTKVIRKNDS